ncbi:MAG: hypothetical protein WCC79_02520 [Nitrososphaeraceae archaeon]
MSSTWAQTVQLLEQEIQNMNESNATAYLNLAPERIGMPKISNIQGSAEFAISLLMTTQIWA